MTNGQILCHPVCRGFWLLYFEVSFYASKSETNSLAKSVFFHCCPPAEYPLKCRIFALKRQKTAPDWGRLSPVFGIGDMTNNRTHRKETNQ